jgi:phosphomannomutase
MQVSRAQSRLIKIVGNLATGLTPGITVGPNQKDVYGRQLDLRPENFSSLFSKNGLDVSPQVREFQTHLQNNDKFRLGIQSVLAGYDVRAKDLDEAFWVFFARSYAKTLVDETGQKDGHTIQIGQDCFERHHRVTLIIAYTLIKSGVLENGGGIVYWGTTDGGSMKLMGTLERAQTGKNGNWAYQTVSHKSAPGLQGVKIGMKGKVVCTDDLKTAIFDPMVKGDYLPLINVENPENYVVTVGDTIPYYTALAERIIRARISLPANLRPEEIFNGFPIGISRDGNPLMYRIEKVLEALGARIIRIDNSDELTEPKAIRDPHESKSEKIRELVDFLDNYNGPLHIPAIDPDGDRVSIISRDDSYRAVNLKGTDLLKLAAYNLATYNPEGYEVKVVADMRALMSVRILGEALNSQNYPLQVIPGVPGYNMFHQALAEHAGVLGIEDTSHTMFLPNTHPIWGAPTYYPNTQGGDNAGLFGIYLLGLAARMTEGRSLAQQLAYIHSTFNVPYTTVDELKPSIPQSHGMAKVAVADAIKELASRYLGSNPNYTLTPFDTGVCIESFNPLASVLVRHSKSGSGFTVGGEVTRGDDVAREFALNLGVALLLQADTDARTAMNDSNHPFHSISDFELSLNDAQLIANRINNPEEVLKEAGKKII